MTATKYGYSTTEAQKLDASHDYFNQALFAGSLAPCRIQITGKGNAKWRGLFIRNGAMNGSQPIDQIKIDEDYFSQSLEQNDLRQVMSTLVHEMAHQAHPSKGHNRFWRSRMEGVGLLPIQIKKGCREDDFLDHVWVTLDHVLVTSGPRLGDAWTIVV